MEERTEGIWPWIMLVVGIGLLCSAIEAVLTGTTWMVGGKYMSPYEDMTVAWSEYPLVFLFFLGLQLFMSWVLGIGGLRAIRRGKQ